MALSSFRPATLQNYLRCLEKFLVFSLSQHHQSKFPFSPTLIAAFVTHLLKSGLKCSTIRSYLSAISAFHKLLGHSDPTNSYLISRLLKTDLTSIQKSSTSLLPLNLNVLKKVIKILPSTVICSYDVILFKSLFLFSYYCCTRACEVVYDPKSLPSHTLKLSDVVICSGNSPSLIVTFRTFKHSTEPVSITLNSCLDSIYCPVRAFFKYISLRGDQPGFIFLNSLKRPLNRSNYATTLKNCISKLGLPGTRYNTHSLRIGRATDLAIAGNPAHIIKNIGRWKSDAYKKYIRPKVSFN